MGDVGFCFRGKPRDMYNEYGKTAVVLGKIN